MRCNLFGGPGCGKSTLAASVYHDLKVENYSVELIREWIKQWAYEGRKPKSFDQTFVFSNQLYLEDSAIQSGVDHIVTDSPLLMQVCYAKRYNYKLWESLLEHAQAFEEEYPSVNIFLSRQFEYEQDGRYEDASQAKWMDDQIYEFLEVHLKKNLMYLPPTSEFVLEHIKENLTNDDN